MSISESLTKQTSFSHYSSIYLFISLVFYTILKTILLTQYQHYRTAGGNQGREKENSQPSTGCCKNQTALNHL